jgi:hypothetical protein
MGDRMLMGGSAGGGPSRRSPFTAQARNTSLVFRLSGERRDFMSGFESLDQRATQVSVPPVRKIFKARSLCGIRPASCFSCPAARRRDVAGRVEDFVAGQPPVRSRSSVTIQGTRRSVQRHTDAVKVQN